MQPQYAYTETNINDIPGALNKIFASMQDPDTSYTRSAACNMIIPLSSPSKVQELEPLVDLLSRVRPARFFVAIIDDSLPKIRAEISARCHIVGKKEHVCSEVIRVASPKSLVKALPSVLRANALTGATTELFLYDPFTEAFEFGSLFGIADSIMFDSKKFSGHVDVLERLLGSKAELLDFAWVGLGNWRDQIRGVFERAVAGLSLKELETITIHTGSNKEDLGHFLLAGWLIERLGLHVQGYADSKFKCSSRIGEKISLEFTCAGKSSQFDLQQTLLSFRNRAKVEVTKEGSELITRVSGTQLNGSAQFEAHSPFDDESLESRISKYFSIGVSIANYRSSLRNALQLRSQWKK